MNSFFFLWYLSLMQSVVGLFLQLYWYSQIFLRISNSSQFNNIFKGTLYLDEATKRFFPVFQTKISILKSCTTVFKQFYDNRVNSWGTWKTFLLLLFIIIIFNFFITVLTSLIMGVHNGLVAWKPQDLKYILEEYCFTLGIPKNSKYVYIIRLSSTWHGSILY